MEEETCLKNREMVLILLFLAIIFPFENLFSSNPIVFTLAISGLFLYGFTIVYFIFKYIRAKRIVESKAASFKNKSE